jgi:hypothetical protein
VETYKRMRQTAADNGIILAEMLEQAINLYDDERAKK